MNRAFKGVWIPKEIWCNKELNITERCFLTEIDSLDNDEGCFASNNYFADFFGLSKSRCSEIINKLEEKGLIKITYEYKENSKAVEKRIIKVVGFSSRCIRESEDVGIRDSEEGVFEKPKDNNISINNKNNNNNSAKEKNGIKVEKEFVDTVIKKWNDIGLNVVRNIKGKRLDSLHARIKEYSKDDVLTVIENVKYSDFLKGNNNRNWTADIDWILKPNNFIKVLEGNYNKNKNQTQKDILSKIDF